MLNDEHRTTNVKVRFMIEWRGSVRDNNENPFFEEAHCPSTALRVTKTALMMTNKKDCSE